MILLPAHPGNTGTARKGLRALPPLGTSRDGPRETESRHAGPQPSRKAAERGAGRPAPGGI